MSTKGKRPMRALTPGDKIEAIQRVNDGESKASVARDIGVPESTLRGWCKNEDKLRYMSSRISSPDTDKSNDGEIPEKRARTESPADAPHSPAATGLDLSNPAVVSQNAQPTTVSTESPVELTTKRNDPPQPQYVPRERRPDPGANISMSAISPLSGFSNISGLTHSHLGTSFNDAANLTLLAQLNPGLTSMTAHPGSRALRSVRSPKPAHNGMLNLGETKHRSRSNHTSDPYRHSSSRSSQHGSSQFSSSTLMEEAFWYWLRSQAMIDLTQTVASYPLQLGKSSDATLPTKPVAPAPAPSSHLDHNRNLLAWQYYKQYGGAMPLPEERLRSASQVPREQSADNILYSHLTKGKTENGRASSSPIQNQIQTGEISETITSPPDPHVVEPAISPEVEVENKEPAADKPNGSGRRQPKVGSVFDIIINRISLNNSANEVATADPNINGSTNRQSTTAEALDHGYSFLTWLESSSDPNVTRIMIGQLRVLLDKLSGRTSRRK